MDVKKLILETAKKGPPRIILHGIPGIGKSTFAAGFPSPVFLPTEDRLGEVKMPDGTPPPAFPVPATYDEALASMARLATEEHEFRTFVLDSADWMEKLISEDILQKHGVENIELVLGGYGKGYKASMAYWSKILKIFTAMRRRDMAVLVTAHTEIKTFNPPDSIPYDRYQIKLYRDNAALLEEWADGVLFANFVSYITKDALKDKKGKAIGSGERLLFTSCRPAYRAKNSWNLPESMPFDVNLLLQEIKK